MIIKFLVWDVPAAKMLSLATKSKNIGGGSYRLNVQKIHKIECGISWVEQQLSLIITLAFLLSQIGLYLLN